MGRTLAGLGQLKVRFSTEIPTPNPYMNLFVMICILLCLCFACQHVWVQLQKAC